MHDIFLNSKVAVRQSESIEDLRSARGISTIISDAESVVVSTLEHGGFSGSLIQRLQVTRRNGTSTALVLKTIDLDTDWTATRTNDQAGREVMVAADNSMPMIWRAFARPYIAYSRNARLSAVLMVDLTDHVADRAAFRLSAAQETAILRAFSRMHATHWGKPDRERDWMNPIESRVSILAPGCWNDGQISSEHQSLFHSVEMGWSRVLEELPSRVGDILSGPARYFSEWASVLPGTVLHGDPRLGNLAILPDGRVSAFDWAGIGRGPALLDVAHYIGINSRTLTRTPDTIFIQYRQMLEHALQSPIPDELWHSMMKFAIAGAARMILWTKGLALLRGDADARDEWHWWTTALNAAISERVL